MERKKVLIISYYWPPMGGGGVQRWLKFVKYLREYGWEPVVYTTEGGEGSTQDESLVKQIPEGIEVIRKEIWEPYKLYNRIAGKSKDAKVQPGLLNEGKGNQWGHKLSVWLRGNVFIPDAKMFWIKPSTRFLIDYLSKNPVSAIISTGPPHTTHLIAHGIKKKTNLPWIADFRDPWTNIDFYDKLMVSAWADRMNKKLERKVLMEADRVVTVSWSWGKDFEELAPIKVSIVTNGFDPADFRDKASVVPDKQFTITHAGSLNADRHPKKLIKVLGELCRESIEFKNKLSLKLIGSVDISILKAIEEHDLDDNLKRIDNLPHNRVIQHICAAAVLLLPLNDTPNVDGVVPGKLYEYLGARRPIICIGKPSGDSAKIVTETKAGIVVDFREETQLKKVIEDYFLAFQEGSLQINSGGIDQYSRQKLAGEIASILNEIT